MIGGCLFVSSVRGLVCFRNRGRVRICNLTARQVVEFPVMEGNNSYSNSVFYFGHDPVNDEYKVLSTVWEVVSKEEERVVRSEHQVLILGAGASRKKTDQCHITHRPFCLVIPINGVLYYRAWDDANRCVVMSFNLSSQEFNLIELPINAGIVWKDICIAEIS